MHFSLPIFRSFLLCIVLATSVKCVSAQWIDLAPLTDSSFSQIDFVSEETAFALVRDKGWNLSVYKTKNGGANWTEVSIPILEGTNYVVQDISFVNEKTGFLSARMATTELESVVLKTTDGGGKWSLIGPDDMPVGNGTAGVHFVDENNGVAGTGNALYTTHDGGENWSKKQLSRYHSVNDITFYDDKRGMASAWDGTFGYKGVIYSTVDGGNSWDSTVFEIQNSSIQSMQFIDEQTIYALSQNDWKKGNRLFTSADNGSSWDTLYLDFLNDSMDQVQDMHFRTGSIGFVTTTNGYIYRTTDKGKNWTVDYSHGATLSFIETYEEVLFAGGSPGVLLKNATILGQPKAMVSSASSLYPNPCGTLGSIRINAPVGSQVRIHNIMGKQVVFTKYEGNQLPLSAFNLTPGTYLIVLPELGQKEVLIVE